jgi:hypothetical protein
MGGTPECDHGRFPAVFPGRLCVLAYFQSSRRGFIPMDHLADALHSEDWQDRVAALKRIQQEKLEISNYSAYPCSCKAGAFRNAIGS